MMRHSLARIVAVFAIGVATTGASALPAAAGEDGSGAVSRPGSTIAEPVPGGFASWEELFDVQGRMNSAAAAIAAAAGSTAHSGFGSFVAAPENRELRVYWRGSVPADVQKVIDQADTQIPVKILPARFTQGELLSEAATLSQHRELVEVGPLPDASGLQIKTRHGASPSSQALAAISSAKVAVFRSDDAAKLDPLTRQDDSSPYYAGARITIGSAGCTNSFAVNHGGRTKLLTAAHCGASGASVYDGGGDYMGPITNRNATRDISLIDARGLGRTWDGPWNEANYTKAVQGASFSSVGNWLCTSGSYSGVRCAIQVKLNNQTIDGQGPLVVAERSDHLNAAGKGDSGGPVFELPSPDNGRVIAKGLISYGLIGYSATCTGVATTCYYRFAYPDVTQTLSYLGATIVTG
jgi:hypothetical protein